MDSCMSDVQGRIVCRGRAPKTTLSVFAGRRKNMRILNAYVERLVAWGLVDEYHVWDFTRDPEDARWIRAYASRAPEEMRRRTRVMRVRNKASWREYYAYYAGLRDVHEDDVLIKCDDDVWFIDVQAFAGFIARRRQHRDVLALFPGVLNNGVCAHLQQRAGLLPRAVHGELPYDTFMGRVVENGDVAHALHAHFLEHRGAFLARSRALGHLGVHKHPLGDRISINFFAVLGADFGLLAGVGEDDEAELSMLLPKRHRRNHGVDLSMVVVHGAFGSQRGAEFDEDAVRARYAELLGRAARP